MGLESTVQQVVSGTPPLNLGGEDSPSKFRGWLSKNTVKQVVSGTPSLNLGVNLHPLNLGGMGLQGITELVCFEAEVCIRNRSSRGNLYL